MKVRFITTINNKKCLEWKITATQGALVSLIYEANAWANEIVENDKVYYHISRNLILQELPLFFEKSDTVYRNLKALNEKGIIEYIKQGKKDLIRLTEKGKTWNFIESEKKEKNSEINPSKIENSDLNPTKLGFKSEKSSDSNPTNKDNNIHKDNNIINIYRSKEFEEAFESYKKMRKSIKKPMTENSVKRMLKKLSKLENEELAIKMLNEAEDKCWLDVYKKEEGNNGNNFNTRYSREKEDKHSKKPDYTKGFDDWN